MDFFSKIEDGVYLNKKIKWMFFQNTWVWFHIIAGDVLQRILLLIGFSYLQTVLGVFIIAVGWEVFEFIKDRKRLKDIYGSKERWLWDSIGDIVGAVLAAIF